MPSFQGSQRRDVRRRLAAAGHSSLPMDTPPEATQWQPPERKPGLYALKALPEHHASPATRIPIRMLPFLAAITGLLLPPAILSGLLFFPDPLATLPASLGERWHNTSAALQYLLDVRSPQGLSAAVGLASCLLAAALAAATRNVRRHRLDDHQGRYRAWGWLSLMLAIAGLTFVLPIGPVVATVMTDATGWDLQSAGRGWWTLLVAATLLPLGIWAVLPLTQRLATGLWLFAALAAWLAAEGIGLGIAAGWQPDAWQLGDTAHWHRAADTLRALMPAFAAIGTLVASRSVVREARGLVQPRPARSRPAKTSETKPAPTAAPENAATVDTAEAEPHHAPAPDDDATADESHALEAEDTEPSADDVAPSPAAIDNNGDDIDDDRRLSKAERRRLRKLARKNRAA